MEIFHLRQVDIVEMVKPYAEIAFVEYQDARRGAMFYDLASLHWDQYVCLSLA